VDFIYITKSIVLALIAFLLFCLASLCFYYIVYPHIKITIRNRFYNRRNNPIYSPPVPDSFENQHFNILCPSLPISHLTSLSHVQSPVSQLATILPGLTINPLGNSSLNSNLITFKPSPNPSSRHIELVLPEAYQTKKSKKSNSLPLNYPENVTAGQSPKSTIRRKYLYDIGFTFDPISSSSTISSLSGLFATSDSAAEAATESTSAWSTPTRLTSHIGTSLSRSPSPSSPSLFKSPPLTQSILITENETNVHKRSINGNKTTENSVINLQN
jgi:hypothetical protein